MENLWRESKAKSNKWKKYDYLNGEKEVANFECQCGKSYKTFPGLYLHFQRSHSQKISTKPSDEECLKKITPSGTIYRYLILTGREGKKIIESSSIEGETNRTILYKEFQGALHDSLFFSSSEAKSKLGSPEEIDSILNLFESYLCEESVRGEKDIPINSIPNYFNHFIVSQRNMSNYCQASEENACQILYKFWEWMHQNKYTDLILEFNTSPETEEGSSLGSNQFQEKGLTV